MESLLGGAEPAIARRRFPRGSLAALVALIGGGAIVVGAWMPWMFYFAGLIPLRGLIGVNGRVLLGAGVAGLILGTMSTVSSERRVRRIARRANALLGLGVIAAAIWLLIGVRELTRVHESNAMLAPRPGVGLVVVLIGGCLLAAAAGLGREKAAE